MGGFASCQHSQKTRRETPILPCPAHPTSPELTPAIQQGSNPNTGAREQVLGSGRARLFAVNIVPNLAGESCPSPGSALPVLFCSSRANSMKCLPGKLAWPLPYQNHLPGPNWKKTASGAAFSKQIMAANNRAAPRWLRPALQHRLSPMGFRWINPQLQTLARGEDTSSMATPLAPAMGQDSCMGWAEALQTRCMSDALCCKA